MSEKKPIVCIIDEKKLLANIAKWAKTGNVHVVSVTPHTLTGGGVRVDLGLDISLDVFSDIRRFIQS